jgi:sensor domain CHASE-containing protein
MPRFWGFISVIIEMDKLIASTEVPLLSQRGYEYHKFGAGNQTTVRCKSSIAAKDTAARPVSHRLHYQIPNGILI